MVKILGISGGKGVGKTTLALRLERLIERSAVFNLADPLKEFCHQEYNIPVEVLWGDSAQRDSWIHPELNTSARAILQGMGKAIGSFDSLFFCRSLAKRIVHSSCKLAIIADVRRKDEVNWIRSVGGIVYHIYPQTKREEDGIESELDRIAMGLADGFGVCFDEAATGYNHLTRLATIDYMKEFLV